jgi:ribosomal protein S1
MKTLKGMQLKTRIVRLISNRDHSQAELADLQYIAGMVELPGQQEGFLPLRNILGRTLPEKEAALNEWFENKSEVEVEVVNEYVKHDSLRYTVSQYPIFRRQRQEMRAVILEKLSQIQDGQPLEGTVLRIDEQRPFAIIDLGNELTGLLHEDELLGVTPDDRRSRLRNEFQPGMPVRVCIRNRRETDHGDVNLYLSERLLHIREEYQKLGLDDPTAIMAASQGNEQSSAE